MWRMVLATCQSWVHGVFDVRASRDIAHRWRPVTLPSLCDEGGPFVLHEDRLKRYTCAMIALGSEHPGTFGVCAEDNDRMTLYVFVDDAVSVVLWAPVPSDAAAYRARAGMELRRWHRQTFQRPLRLSPELSADDHTPLWGA